MLPTFISGILNIHFRIIQMRNIAIVPGLLALLLTGVLFYVVYHKPQVAPVVTAGSELNQQASNSLRMAYFNLDSLEAHYQYFKDVLDQVKGKENEFATVIVFLREGHGGFMFIHNEKTRQQFTIKERMLMEVAKSIEIAYELCNLFTVYNVDMEVHADINTNPHFKSNDALKEAMGYILGMGFAFKAKPEAFASSCCADKACN